MNQYAIFGGTFDPVHCGHVALVRYVLSHVHDTIVIVSCAYQNPHKAHNADGASAQHRLAMIRCAFANIDRVIVDESEIQARGISYTVDTIMRFHKIYNPIEKLYFIIGSDIVQNIHQWKNIEKLSDIVTLLIYPRLSTKLSDDNYALLHHSLHSYSFDYVLMNDAPCIDISSTDIRAQYKKNCIEKNTLPPSVHEYICQHSLYR